MSLIEQVAGPMPTAMSYVFKGYTLYHLPDGDTADIVTDFGCNKLIVQRFRFARINAPEIGTPLGPPCRDFVQAWLTRPRIAKPKTKNPIWIWSREHDDRDRFIAEIWWADTGENLNDVLLNAGLGVVPYP